MNTELSILIAGNSATDSPKDPPGPALGASLALGTAVGLWWIALVWLYETVVASGWPGGADVPTDLRVSQIKALLRLESTTFAGILFGCSFLVVTLWAWLERKTRMDPGKRAGQSLVWTLRNLLPIQAVGVVLFLGLLSLEEVISLMDSWYLGIVVAVPMGFFILMPFSALRPSVMASRWASGWWRPVWPGLGPLMSILLLWVGEALIYGGILYPFPDLDLLLALISMVLFPLTAAFMAAKATVLVDRLGPPEAVKRFRKISWKQVGPFLALQSRLFLGFMIFFPPVIGLWIFLWLHIPTLAQWASSQGRFMDYWGRTLIMSSNFVSEYFWLIFMPAICFGPWLLYGRWVWLVGRQPELIEGYGS